MRWRTAVSVVALAGALAACTPGEVERASEMLEAGSLFVRQSFDAGYQADGLSGGLANAAEAVQWIGMAVGGTFGGP